MQMTTNGYKEIVLLLGTVTGVTTTKINVEVSQGVKNRSTIKSRYTALWNIHKGATPYSKDIHSFVLIDTWLTIGRKCKQPKWPSADEWILKLWHICAMEFHSAVKTNNVMKFIGKWIELEIIIPNEITQTEKGKCQMFFLIYVC